MTMLTLEIIANDTNTSALFEDGNETMMPIHAEPPELEELPYLDGEVIEQQWNVVFIFLAYAIAFMGSYSAIRLLEHGLWRSERERENATSKSLCNFSSR